MSMFDKFTIFDLVNHFLFGLVILVISDLYAQNFGITSESYIFHFQDVVGTTVLFGTAYIIGQLFSGYLFSFMVRISLESPIKPLSRVEKAIGIIIFGIKQKKDLRINPFHNSEDLHNIAARKAYEVIGIDISKADDMTRYECFYIILNYVVDRSSLVKARIDRYNLRTNIMAATAGVCLYVAIVNIVAIIAKISTWTGTFPLTSLVIVQVLSMLLLRISSRKFQIRLFRWWKSVWRAFVSM